MQTARGGRARHKGQKAFNPLAGGEGCWAGKEVATASSGMPALPVALGRPASSPHSGTQGSRTSSSQLARKNNDPQTKEKGLAPQVLMSAGLGKV